MVFNLYMHITKYIICLWWTRIACTYNLIILTAQFCEHSTLPKIHHSTWQHENTSLPVNTVVTAVCDLYHLLSDNSSSLSYMCKDDMTWRLLDAGPEIPMCNSEFKNYYGLLTILNHFLRHLNYFNVAVLYIKRCISNIILQFKVYLTIKLKLNAGSLNYFSRKTNVYM